MRQRRAARRGIVLTPEAVVVETLVPAVVIPWSGLREIHTFHLRWGWGSLPAPTQNWIGFVVDDPGAIEGVGRPAAAVEKRLKSRPTVGVFATEILRIDPLAALAGMQWYLEHPEDRHRLATLAGLTPFGL